MVEKIKSLIDAAQKVVIIQADNPDADSLGSALALEQILEEMGKNVYLYCGVDVPTYLRYFEGWSRVNGHLPSQFDLSIVVDTTAATLLQKLDESGHAGWLHDKPCLVIDHHDETQNDIPFASEVLNRPDLSSTGEVIFDLAKQLSWPLDKTSGSYIMFAILGDTQGLTNSLARAGTYRVMAELTEMGVDRPQLEDLRREASKMDPKIYKYKAALIERTEFFADGKIATVTIPQDEINEFSPLYNPAPLIQSDMLQTVGVNVAIVFKHYRDRKILCSIRCNHNAPVGAALAEHFGGGGHPYASGFKIQNGRPFNEIKSECLDFTAGLLNKIEKEADETIQHAS